MDVEEWDGLESVTQVGVGADVTYSRTFRVSTFNLVRLAELGGTRIKNLS